jgi:hypothetical protein
MAIDGMAGEVRMKRKLLTGIGLAFGWLLLVSSCEPFLFSMFPGYLADATAVADLNGSITGSNVEHFDFCVLNNGTLEYVFVLANNYDGTKTLFVYDSDLVLKAQFANTIFGSRHFVDMAGNFVIGGAYLNPGITSASTINIIPNNPWGTDGNGCVLSSNGVLANVLLQAGHPFLDGRAFNNSWGVATLQPMVPSAQIDVNSIGYNLVYTGRLYNVMIGTVPVTVSILSLRDWNGWPEEGLAVLYVDGQYTDYSSPLPILTSLPPGRYVRSLGGLASDNEAVFAVNEGLVLRGADGTMRLVGWDGQLRAVTRDNGASGQVLIDFSPVNYYYVLDPASLQLIKARDWWQKN